MTAPRDRATFLGMISRFTRPLVLLAFAAVLFSVGSAMADPIRILAFGDSLTAGYGLPAGDAFPIQLEAALKAPATTWP